VSALPDAAFSHLARPKLRLTRLDLARRKGWFD
jgi:hypothetical protein